MEIDRSTKRKKKELNLKSKKKKKKEEKIDNDDDDDKEENNVENCENLIEKNELNFNSVEWTSLGVPEIILKSLREQNFETPTQIQSLTLAPAILGRRDILGAAETGSGKTLAFGIPIIHGILELKKKQQNEADNEKNNNNNNKFIASKSGKFIETKNENSINSEIENSDNENSMDSEDENFDNENSEVSDDENSENEENFDNENSEDSEDENSEIEENFNLKNEMQMGCVKVIDNIKIKSNVNSMRKPLYALILTPTRELAIQIKNHLTKAAKYTDIQIAVVLGGMAAVKQERILKKCPEIVIATPGRFWELVSEGNPHLNQLDSIK